MNYPRIRVWVLDTAGTREQVPVAILSYMFAAVVDHYNLPGDAIKATRAELDFIYMAQYLSHTDCTLQQLEEYNKAFHRYKDIFIRTGAR